MYFPFLFHNFLTLKQRNTLESKNYKKVTASNSENYKWGNECRGWHFVKSDILSIIKETMPPGTEEQLHYHYRAQQFFYILSGTALFNIDGEEIAITNGEGIYILPGAKHKIKNIANIDLEFIVVSQPKSHGDRVNI